MEFVFLFEALFHLFAVMFIGAPLFGFSLLISGILEGEIWYVLLGGAILALSMPLLVAVISDLFL